MGVDVHVLTVNTGFFKYDRPPDVARTIADECNEELSEMMRAHPDRFMGLASIPLQDVPAAIDVMEHAMGEMGFKGITIGDHVDGVTLDDPRFTPFWAAVEQLGAVVFFHQCAATVVERPDGPLRPAQRDREPRRARDHVRHARVRRRDGPFPRPEALPRPRRRLHGVRRGADGQGLAGRRDGEHARVRGRADVPRAGAQRVREPLLVRLVHVHRVDPALPPGCGGERPGRPRHGLPGADDGAGSGALDQRDDEPLAGGEGRDPRENPARLLGL